MRLAPVFLAVAFSLGGMSLASAANKAPRTAKPVSAKATPACSTEITGSRIRRREGDCAESSYPIRAFSQEELERSGAFDLRGAMRLLDPRF